MHNGYTRSVNQVNPDETLARIEAMLAGLQRGSSRIMDAELCEELIAGMCKRSGSQLCSKGKHARSVRNTSVRARNMRKYGYRGVSIEFECLECKALRAREIRQTRTLLQAETR